MGEKSLSQVGRSGLLEEIERLRRRVTTTEPLLQNVLVVLEELAEHGGGDNEDGIHWTGCGMSRCPICDNKIYEPLSRARTLSREVRKALGEDAHASWAHLVSERNEAWALLWAAVAFHKGRTHDDGCPALDCNRDDLCDCEFGKWRIRVTAALESV